MYKTVGKKKKKKTLEEDERKSMVENIAGREEGVGRE